VRRAPSSRRDRLGLVAVERLGVSPLTPKSGTVPRWRSFGFGRLLRRVDVGL